MNITAEFIETEKRMAPSFLPVIEINKLADNAYLSCRVVIYLNNEPNVILNIYTMRDKDGCLLEQCFKEIKTDRNVVAILHGVHVHIYDTTTRCTSSFALNDYVVSLYSIPNIYSDHLTSDFIVTTFEYTFLVNIKNGVIWRSGQCAIDCVSIHSIENGIIYGAGDWDPPGGYVPFALDLHTGEFISQPPGYIG